MPARAERVAGQHRPGWHHDADSRAFPDPKAIAGWPGERGAPASRRVARHQARRGGCRRRPLIHWQDTLIGVADTVAAARPNVRPVSRQRGRCSRVAL